MILKPKQVDAFKAWLVARGAQVLTPTNEYEVVRFKAGNTTCVVYQNGKKTKASFNCAAAAGALTAFMDNLQWRASPVTPHQRAGRPLQQAIRERDGGLCFFCGTPVEPGINSSMEHLVARTHQGPHHISNMFLAHMVPCNRDAGHLSAPEKVALAIENRVNLALSRLLNSEVFALAPAAAAAAPAPIHTAPRSAPSMGAATRGPVTGRLDGGRDHTAAG